MVSERDSDVEQLRRVERVLECDVRDELLVYVPDAGTVVALNASARAVWELCRDDTSIATIAGALAERFGLAGDAFLPDVRDAVERLRGFGLLLRDSG